MKINWKFWKGTGETFFTVRIEYKIKAEHIEIAVSNYYKDIATKKDIIAAIKWYESDYGNPAFWSFDECMTEDEKLKASRDARSIIEPLIPQAYMNALAT